MKKIILTLLAYALVAMHAHAQLEICWNMFTYTCHHGGFITNGTCANGYTLQTQTTSATLQTASQAYDGTWDRTQITNYCVYVTLTNSCVSPGMSPYQTNNVMTMTYVLGTNACPGGDDVAMKGTLNRQTSR